MLNEMIRDNYDIQITELKLLDQYFGTKIYLAETQSKQYIVKMLPLSVPNLENEEKITRFLTQNGIQVAKFLLTKNGEGCVKTDQMQFHVQEFIKGTAYMVNTAPKWLMDKSALLLGQIHHVLQGYVEMKTNFSRNFFDPSHVNESKQQYFQRLDQALEAKNTSLTSALKERIKHLERIERFTIDTDKLTYANSHGDFYIGQLVVQDHNVTVIDWTSACKLPIALEVMMSYAFAAPECKCGEISSEGLKRYISHYVKHFYLSEYDIKIIPYLYYFQQIMCHYSPPYDGIPNTYKPICDLINNLTNWLYENTESLEKELQR